MKANRNRRQWHPWSSEEYTMRKTENRRRRTLSFLSLSFHLCPLLSLSLHSQSTWFLLSCSSVHWLVFFSSVVQSMWERKSRERCRPQRHPAEAKRIREEARQTHETISTTGQRLSKMGGGRQRRERKRERQWREKEEDQTHPLKTVRRTLGHGRNEGSPKWKKSRMHIMKYKRWVKRDSRVKSHMTYIRHTGLLARTVLSSHKKEARFTTTMHQRPRKHHAIKEPPQGSILQGGKCCLIPNNVMRRQCEWPAYEN